MGERLREIPVRRHHHRMLPVWFFVGVLLLAYGVIILLTSLADLHKPTTVVLGRYHAGIWGGVVLIVIGGFYTLRFRPRKPN